MEHFPGTQRVDAFLRSIGTGENQREVDTKLLATSFVAAIFHRVVLEGVLGAEHLSPSQPKFISQLVTSIVRAARES